MQNHLYRILQGSSLGPLLTTLTYTKFVGVLMDNPPDLRGANRLYKKQD
jgi:hypothetical protein